MNKYFYRMPTSVCGLSLIEILVSFTLLSLMFLYLDAAQVQSLKQMKMHYYFNMAIQQLLNANDILQVDKSVDSGLLQQWQRQLRNVLPEGYGSFTPNGETTTVNIMWGNKKSACQYNQLHSSFGCMHSEIPSY
jgi:Tfp pilus assembly protein PilV